MKTVASIIRECQLKPLIEDYSRTYITDRADIENVQLKKFNLLWNHIQQDIPYYRNLSQNQTISRNIQSWNEFIKLPIMTRQLIQADPSTFINPNSKLAGWSTTGGSSGTPLRVPYQESEVQLSLVTSWVGRSFYNISVGDRMFHLWGHSHLFGTTWKRHLKQLERKIRNTLLGHKLFSAYHLTPERLREAGKQILWMRPDYIIGYSRSLTLLARENLDRAEAFKHISIKAVIATTEGFIQPQDATLVSQVFDCPVAMEYGAAETGVIAYTHPSDNQYRVFWDRYLVEAIPINATTAKLLLTSLYPRAMPLIRYDIGDSVLNYSTKGHSITHFEAIQGRDNDLVEVAPGEYVHPVALIHCIQYLPGILGVQIIQEKNRSITISILLNKDKTFSKEDENIIRRNLATLSPILKTCNITCVTHLEQTIAGKTKWVIRQ